MKTHLIYFLLLSILQAVLSTNATAQNVNSVHENGIYRSDTDFMHHNLLFGFDKNDEHGFKLVESSGNQLKIKTEDSTYAFYFDAIWGFRRNNIDRRIFQHQAYNVEYIGKCCIYSRDMGPRSGIFYFFSVDIDATIYELSKKNLISAYYFNPEFIKRIKGLSIWKSIYTWDKEKKRFKFIDWLEE
jgi:DNA-dependent RNA polymerase auxiliary subunit epsilon